MNSVTLQDYRDLPSLAFELHRAARRKRARAIGFLFMRLYARMAEKLTAGHRLADLATRWG